MKQLKRTYTRRAFEDWYADAEKYYLENGNLLVERDYLTVDGFRLGRWIERQRAVYNGITGGNQNDVQIKMLENIGMVWKLENRYSWDDWIQKATAYYEQYGDLAVPKSYITEDGFALGNWIGETRKKFSKDKLRDFQIEQLDKIGMIWSFGTRRSFSEWYKDALDYYFENGDLLVTTFYTTENGDRLGQWISIQRAKHAGREGLCPLTEKEIALLDTIDMVWDIRDVRDSQWDLIYHDVLCYKETFGKLPLWPMNIKASNGVLMPRWISYQRKMLQNDKLPDEKVKKLSLIGIEKSG